MTTTTPRRHELIVGEIRLVSVDMRGKLDEGELLDGVPAIIEMDTTDLSISNQGVSTEELVINKLSVPIGQAIQFKVSGAVAGTKYRIKITVSTDSDPAQTLIVYVGLSGVAE